MDATDQFTMTRKWGFAKSNRRKAHRKLTETERVIFVDATASSIVPQRES